MSNYAPQERGRYLLNFFIQWSDEDNAYLADVLSYNQQFSLLKAHGDTPEEAARPLMEVMSTVLEEGDVKLKPLGA